VGRIQPWCKRTAFTDVPTDHSQQGSGCLMRGADLGAVCYTNIVRHPNWGNPNDAAHAKEDRR